MREETLLTGRGGRLHGRLWSGDNGSLGVLIAIHGLGDHSARYRRVAEHLVTCGWQVFAFDLPGHGRSPGGRGRVDSFQGLLRDIHAVRESLAARLPGMPQVLMGHSMGGNLTLNYALRRNEGSSDDLPLAGVILCAPMLLPPTPPPRPHIFAAWLTGHLMPWVQIDRPVDIASLTADAEEAQQIASDPFVHSKVNIYLATQLLSQGRWALDHARAIEVPLLVMSGDEDPLIDRSACEHMVIRGGAKATLVQWPGRRHDLFHDIGYQEVLAGMDDWLQQCVSPDR
ncbi:MAG: lysophospholipase [Rubripirellula sp.]